MTHGIGLKRQTIDTEHERRQSRLTIPTSVGAKKGYDGLVTARNSGIQRNMLFAWGPVMDESDPDLIFKWGRHLFQAEMQDSTLWPQCWTHWRNILSTPALLSKYMTNVMTRAASWTETGDPYTSTQSQQ